MWCSLALPSCSSCGTHRSAHTDLCREGRNAGKFWPPVSTQWAADDAEGWLLLYRSAFVLLSKAWSLEPCVLSRCQRDRCDLLASSSAGSWAIFTQAGRYGKAWVTDENPWGALDYGEWKIKRNHIGHRYKRSPLFLFYPSLFFSPLPYQAVMNVEKQLPSSKCLRMCRFQMLFYANTSTLPCPQHPELTLLSSSLLPVSFYAAIGKKHILVRKPLIIILKGEIYTLSSVFGLSTAGGAKQQLTHFWHWSYFDVSII